MKPPTTYLNSPVRNCLNCAHRSGRGAGAWCCLTGYYLEDQRQRPGDGCDEHFSGWRPRPRCRSMLRWVWDRLLSFR